MKPNSNHSRPRSLCTFESVISTNRLKDQNFTNSNFQNNRHKIQWEEKVTATTTNGILKLIEHKGHRPDILFYALILPQPPLDREAKAPKGGGQLGDLRYRPSSIHGTERGVGQRLLIKRIIIKTRQTMEYCTDEHDVLPEMPVSPTGQYFNSSVLQLSILAVLELEIPIDDSLALTLLRDVFLPINPRFSSIMVGDKKGVKKWKRVEVKLEDHINIPSFPAGMALEFYDDHFNDYLSKLSLDRFPQNKPLWEIHIIKYPTSNAPRTLIFKLHHALGDGFSLMGALLSCLQRADNPSLPLTFPSRESSSKKDGKNKGIFRCFGRVFSRIGNTVSDFGSAIIKSNFGGDGPTPVRSGEDGIEFRPSVITTVTFSLDRIKQIKAKLGVTINDVIVGVIFLGTRLYMQASSSSSSSSHDDQQQQLGDSNANATALVVLNTRAVSGYKTIGEMVKPNSEFPWGNHFTFLHVTIPKLKHSKNGASTATDDQLIANPIRFVKKVHKMVKKKRNSAAIFITGRMLEILRKFRGPEAVAQHVYNTLKNSSIAMSNLIGPVEQMALANHPIKGLYFTLVGSPESLAITIMSYVGKLRITIRMEKGFVDPQKFNSCIENAFNMISKAAVQNDPPSNSNED